MQREKDPKRARDDKNDVERVEERERPKRGCGKVLGLATAQIILPINLVAYER